MLARLIANVLIVLGAVLLLTTGALAAYSSYEEQEVERTLAQEDDLAQVRVETVTRAPTTAAAAKPGDLPAARSTPRPTATALPITPAKRLIIKKIGVDTRVAEAPVRNGEWKVPKFVAGHLAGTAQPGEGGNVVLAGHIASTTDGDVFADLGRLKAGDEVRLLTVNRELRYVVRQLRTVKANDTSVVAPQGRETLTLVTCTGAWDPVKRDYSHRLIAVATLAPAAEEP
ncbi:MAG: sortase [Chloroflexota bacterium]